MTEREKTELYADYHDKILRYIRSKITNPTQAEDLCSAVFLKVYEKLDSFDESKASLSTWIYTIARNTLTDHFRTRRVSEEIPETMAEDYSLEDEVINAQMLENLAAALETLDERGRDIIIGRYYARRTLREIALSLGISYAYVKVLHNKALEQLKKYLEG